MPVRPHQTETVTRSIANQIATLTAGYTMIVASNRGPVEFYRAADGRLSTRRGAGGVVTRTGCACARCAAPVGRDGDDGSRSRSILRCPLTCAYRAAGPPTVAGSLRSSSRRHVSALL